MKQVTALSLILMLFVFISCSKNSNSNKLDGDWHVIDVGAGNSGIVCAFEADYYVWSFDSNQLQRSVNFPVFSNCPLILADGESRFEILDENDKEYLQIDDRVFGEMRFEGDTLILDNNSLPDEELADAFIYFLTR